MESVYVGTDSTSGRLGDTPGGVAMQCPRDHPEESPRGTPLGSEVQSQDPRSAIGPQILEAHPGVHGLPYGTLFWGGLLVT